MSVLRFLAHTAIRLFFDHVEIDGIENVPREGPLLVVANHTNGLVDGLMLVHVLPRRDASLTAKSTLRKNPLLALLMKLGDVVPFYRSQDHVDVRKNVDSFAAIKERFARGEVVCIFPEGVSHSDASMRDFKSGAERIAHEANVPILPIGLHYDAKQRFRSSVLVRIGKPMPPSTTEAIRERIEALTTSFDRVREARWLQWTAELLETHGDDPQPLDRQSVDVARRAQRLATLRDDYERADRDRVAAIFAKLRAYRRELRRRGVAQHEVFLSMHPLQALFFTLRELELVVVGGAIVTAGLLQHGAGLLIDRALTKKLSVDLDHWASNAIFYGFAIFPLTWIAGSAAVWMLASPRWALVYAATIPFTLVYTMMWIPRAANAVRRAKTFVRFLFDRDAQRRLQKQGRELIGDIRASTLSAHK